MTAEAFLDLDAAYRERAMARKPVVLKLLGRDWEFSGVMPASVLTLLARWEVASPGDLTPQQAMMLLGEVVPDEYLRAWGEAGIGVSGDGLDPIIEQALEFVVHTWLARETEIAGSTGDTPGEAQAPATGPPPWPTSSSTGDSSSPTSNASTASTSASNSSG